MKFDLNLIYFTVRFYTQFNNKLDLSSLTIGGLTCYLIEIEKTSSLMKQVTRNENDGANYGSTFYVVGTCPSLRRNVCMKWFTCH